ncbi:MAG: alpha/beta hydrolase [Methanomicrobiaceae archaeon]|nr:alpha/beta hydrolase [Methanomicrobiaceae archaeon]
MNLPLGDEPLLIEGSSSFLLIGKVHEPFALCIETCKEEYCQTLERGDLVVVSAPEGGDVEQARMLLELVRTFHAPLVVLPRGHPGSKRLLMVVSAGPEILLACGIQRGTHPEQHLICASDELNGAQVRRTAGGVEISLPSEDISYRYL